MFRALTDLTFRRRKLVLILTGVFVVVAGGIGGPVPTILAAGTSNFENPNSESAVMRKELAHATGANPEFSVTAIVNLKQDPDSPASRARVEQVVQRFKSDRSIALVYSYYNTHSPVFVSRDRRSTYLAISTKPLSAHEEPKVGDRLKKLFKHENDVKLGGAVVANAEAATVVRGDLARAEAIAFPLILLIALFVFRGLIAAMLPLFCGGILILGTFLGLRVVNEFTTLSIYALNLVTGLGLGLAIDYSLFIVSRYREELARVGPGREALARTLQTAGRTVLFSSLTVGAALASLTVFPQSFLYSMGIGGVLVAIMAAATALIALPALLAALGPRVNALSPQRWRRSLEVPPEEQRGGFWYALSHGVMRHRVLVAGATIAFLVVLGLPVLGIKFTGISPTVLPKSQSARQVEDILHTEFPKQRTEPIIVAVNAPRSSSSQVTSLADQLRRLPDAVDVTRPQPVGNNIWRIDVTPKGETLSNTAQHVVHEIRGLASQYTVLVGGRSAAFVDQRAAIADNLPLALAILCLVTILILFAMTGSVILPVKALLMNGASLTAAFGIIVFIFQRGHLEGLLQFTSQHALELTQPIVLAATAFGLSTDYGVFLLTRIKEARDAGESETEAIAIGLERTGRIVTAAALLFAIAVGAFATSGIVFIKMLGLGIALAVLIDATIVRALLVPSLMALLGARNWWAPAPLKRLHARLGFSEAETSPATAAR